MTPTRPAVLAPTAAPTRRTRDAAASRAALFHAAQELFGKKGFERTTIREIGQHAGVDAALIARYFGSKADLYVAVVVAERMDDRTDSGDDRTDSGDGRTEGRTDRNDDRSRSGDSGALDQIERPYEGLGHMVDTLVSRSDQHGPGPIMQALIRSDTSVEILEASKARLRRRLVAPLAADMDASGVDRSQLRAEITVAALIGISLGRTLGWFEELTGADKDELVGLVVGALEESSSGPPAHPARQGSPHDTGSAPPTR